MKGDLSFTESVGKKVPNVLGKTTELSGLKRGQKSAKKGGQVVRGHV